MNITHVHILQKHGEWVIKLNCDAYLGPYSHGDAVITAVALADAAWQLGYDATVTEESHGVRRTIWNHPAQRHKAYA